MYTYIWVEGYDNLYEFCKKRFNSTPYMCECTGHCGGARIHNIYKEDKDGHWWDIKPYDGDYDGYGGLTGWECCVAHYNNIQRWAYIDDLLPRTK